MCCRCHSIDLRLHSICKCVCARRVEHKPGRSGAFYVWLSGFRCFFRDERDDLVAREMLAGRQNGETAS